MHEYLGIDLYYSEDGKVKISMINYVQKILGAFPEEIENSTTFPGDEYLFQRRDEDYPKADFLPEEQAWGYHCSTAQLLFIFYR